MDIAKLMINEKAFMADTDAVYSFKRYIKEGEMEVNIKFFQEPLGTWSITISDIDTICIDACTLQYKINRQLDHFRFVGGVPMCNVFGILGINELIPVNVKLVCSEARLNFCERSDIELFPHFIRITGLRSGKYDFEDYCEKDLGIVHKELELQWRRPVSMPRPEKVIFNNPATIVIWSDGTKTVVKCGPNDTYSKEAGLALCYMKKTLGNKGNYNNMFRRWIKEEDHD